MNRLPPQFVDEGLEKAKDIRIFGVPLIDMDREEAIAAAVAGWEAHRRQKEVSDEALKTLNELIGAAKAGRTQH